VFPARGGGRGGDGIAPKGGDVGAKIGEGGGEGITVMTEKPSGIEELIQRTNTCPF